MKASDLFVKCLEAEGVKYVFGVPGEENLDLLESMRESSIKFITTRHEQAAVFMAATFGRLTGKAGVALSTLGPGATNLVTGVAYAQLGGMPLLVITGQKPIRKSKQGRFQIVDIVQMMTPLTKMSETIVSADRIPSLIRQAFKVAESELPGAVHLELPEDIAVEESDVAPILPVKIRRAGPDPKAINMALELLKESKSPIVLVAAGANRKLVRKHLQAFLDKTKIPFISTQMGKGVIDEASELYLGTTALSAGDFVHKMLEKSDCVLVVGHNINEKPPVVLSSQERNVIHLNFNEADVDDVYIPTLEVVGDLAHSIWALTEDIIPSKKWNFEYFFNLKNKLQEHINEKSKDDSFPLKPQRLVADLQATLPNDGILALDNGMYKLWIARSYNAHAQNTVLLDNALATMGAGLPGAMGAKILFPDKAVVALVGDGGLMMSSQEIETAIRLKLNLVVVIVNDNGYGMIKWKQQGADFDNFALEFSNPDFVKFAESFGAHGTRVENAAEFSKKLKHALESGGVWLIDCPIDYSENILVFDKELKEKTKNL
ncbi:MAG: acetolactate synthase large subunit [Candidatus Magasanikbacteria bacterium]|nr:acetolactate synthase large subunit [Candidatus Magasanikbacteria bacterium]